MAKKKMLGDLNQLKHEYLAKGGEDPAFIKKLSNLENFLEHGKKIEPVMPQPVSGPAPTMPAMHSMSISPPPIPPPIPMGAGGPLPPHAMAGIPSGFPAGAPFPGGMQDPVFQTMN